MPDPAPALNSKDFEVSQPPSDTISAMEFAPMQTKNLLCAASWDKTVRFWDVEMSGRTNGKNFQALSAPALDISWSDDGTQIFMGTCDGGIHQWDLQADQLITLGIHQKGVRTCHWIKAKNYSCLMTGSWDKTVKFWDTRSSTPLLSRELPDRCYAADVHYPLAVVSCACRTIVAYSLDNGPVEYRRYDGPAHQVRSVAIFCDQTSAMPAGWAVGSIGGRVAFYHLDLTTNNFNFRCHRTISSTGTHNIYAVNDVKFHPVHRNSLVTVGSNGCYYFWDKSSRTRISEGQQMNQSLTKCCFNADGQIFAYALGYDWAQGHEHFDLKKPPQIFLHPCFEETKPSER